jgi:hypothetical protein
MLMQLTVDIEHKNRVQVKDGGLQQCVQPHTRGGKVIVHKQKLVGSHNTNMRRTRDKPLPHTAIACRRLRGCSGRIALRRKVRHKYEGGLMVEARRAADLVVTLVQVAVLAHHK